MSYKNPIIPGSILSHTTQVKESKEALEQKPVEVKPLKVECGCDNPGKFGKHNPNFNKNNIGSKRE